jgi:hypothetical protein
MHHHLLVIISPWQNDSDSIVCKGLVNVYFRAVLIDQGVCEPASEREKLDASRDSLAFVLCTHVKPVTPTPTRPRPTS